MQEVESFLHRSGRTGRAGRHGTAIAMYMPKEYNYFKKVLQETKVDNCEIIAPPAPKAVMEAAAKAVREFVGSLEAHLYSFAKDALAHIVTNTPE